MKGEVWAYAGFNNHDELGLLGKGQTLARSLGVKAAAIVSVYAGEVDCLFHHGADRVYCIDAEGSPVVQANALHEICKKYQPGIILFPATTEYSAIAARTAALLETGLTADCIELSIDENSRLRQIRPAFGGGVIAEVLCGMRSPQMATVRSGLFSEPLPDKKRVGKVIHFVSSSQLVDPVRFVARRRISAEFDLREAEIIVAGGKGVGSRRGFRDLAVFASRIGGVVGASRSAVDSGYADYNQQIGQTGVTVSPELYIAFGISGSFQHIAGMNRSSKIVAVNSDPKAPIFDYADYAIIGDWEKVLHEIMSIL